MGNSLVPASAKQQAPPQEQPRRSKKPDAALRRRKRKPANGERCGRVEQHKIGRHLQPRVGNAMRGGGR